MCRLWQAGVTNAPFLVSGGTTNWQGVAIAALPTNRVFYVETLTNGTATVKYSYFNDSENTSTATVAFLCQLPILAVQIAAVDIDDAPTNGVIVLTGSTVTLRTTVFPLDVQLPESEPKWFYQFKQGNGRWSSWMSYGVDAHGLEFVHTTSQGGIFRAKAVLTIGGCILESHYERKRDEAIINPPWGVPPSYGPGRKGYPDAYGVADSQIQIAICREAQMYYGSTNYDPGVAVPALYGFPAFPASGNSIIRCNLFVAHRATAVGAVVPKINGNFFEYPPLANEWAGIEDTNIWPGNPTFIERWLLLPMATPPQPGWIIAHPRPADAGHCGIIDYDGEGIGAGSESGVVTKNYYQFWDGTSHLRKYEEP